MINPQKQKELDDLYQSIKNEESKTREDIFVVYVSISKLVREYLIIEEKVGVDIFSEYGSDILDKSKSLNTYTKFKKLFPNSNWQIEHYLKGFYRLQGVLNKTVNPTNAIKLFQLKTTKENVSTIIEHLEKLLKNQNTMLPTSKSKVNPEKTFSIYEKIRSRIDFFGETLESLAFDKITFPDSYWIDNGIDHLLISSEIDQLKNEFSDTYPRYLAGILQRYNFLKERLNYLMFEADDVDIPNSQFIIIFQLIIETTTKYLNELLTPEPEIQGTPKSIKTPPQNQTVFNRNQTALLFWYLRKSKMISQSVLNKDLAYIIEPLTGYSATTMEDVLKSDKTDVWQLGKGNDKVTPSDFVTIIQKLKNLIIQIETDYTKPDKKK